jgi:hypothetical protein
MLLHLMGKIRMKKREWSRFLVLLMIGLFILPGFVSAIRPTSALYDQTGLTTTIDATCIGTLVVDHDMDWGQTNTPDGDIHSATLRGDEVRTDTTYRENTLAASGTTKYTKDFSMDGSNATQGTDNLGVRHTINYLANESEGGQMLYDEQGTITQYGRGTPNNTEIKCVFASGSGGAAGFGGYVSAGSLMDVKEVAAVTQMGGRMISADAKTPTNLRYAFDAQGVDSDTKDKLATGSASVYQNTNFETYGKDPSSTNTTTKIDDRQNTQARGLFDLAQTVGYTSTY